MSNDYYSPSGSPSTGSALASAPIRSEDVAVAAGFDLLPTLSGNGNKVVVINAGGTAQSSKSLVGTPNQITITIGGDFTFSLPQDIHSSAGPTFASLTLTGFGNFLSNTGSGPGMKEIAIGNTGGAAILCVESSVGGTTVAGSTAYATILYNNVTTPVHIGIGSAVVATFASTGIEDTPVGSVTARAMRGTSVEVTAGGSASISTGVGSTKMTTGNAATNAAWIPFKYAGITYFVPGWTAHNP